MSNAGGKKFNWRLENCEAGLYLLIMREIKAEIIIESSADTVWKILTDFERYPEWNPFMKSISGEQRVGAKLRIAIQPVGASGMTFKPTVLDIKENRELHWLGKLLVSGIFDGEHSLVIEPIEANKIRFVNSEKFTGILVSLFSGTLDGTEKGFELMNKALKERAEKQAAD